MTLQVTLDETQFRALLAGRRVFIRMPDGTNVELLLTAVSWKRLVQTLLDAVDEPHYPSDPPEAREFLPARKKRK
jgi:hypothetical protein